MQNGKLEIYER